MTREVNMAYTNNDIAAKAREIAPEICADNEELLHVFCLAADAELKSRLKNPLSAGDNEELFVTAAGMIAAAMLMENSGDDISSFSAGSLSVSVNDDSSAAKSLRRRAESLLHGLTESGDFAFVGVPG